MRILVFGDSIAYGAWDTEGGWVDRMKRDFHSLTVHEEGGTVKHQLLNLGIGGNTSRQLLTRIESECESRKSKSWPTAIIISIGTNDSRGKDSMNAVEVSLEEYRANLRSLIAKARLYTERILLVGLTPIAQDVLAFKNYFYLKDRIKEYDRSMGDIAEEMGLPKVDILTVLDTQEWSEMLSRDGLHPNDSGHKKVYELVRPHLLSLIEQ